MRWVTSVWYTPSPPNAGGVPAARINLHQPRSFLTWRPRRLGIWDRQGAIRCLRLSASVVEARQARREIGRFGCNLFCLPPDICIPKSPSCTLPTPTFCLIRRIASCALCGLTSTNSTHHAAHLCAVRSFGRFALYRPRQRPRPSRPRSPAQTSACCGGELVFVCRC